MKINILVAIPTKIIVIGLDTRKRTRIKAKGRILNSWAKSDPNLKVKHSNWTTVPHKKVTILRISPINPVKTILHGKYSSRVVKLIKSLAKEVQLMSSHSNQTNSIYSKDLTLNTHNSKRDKRVIKVERFKSSPMMEQQRWCASETNLFKSILI